MFTRLPQSVAIRVPLKAYLASDHVSAATGKTIAIVISKNGAAFGNPSAGATNATGISNGWYYVDLSTTDCGSLGPLIVRGTEGTIDDCEVEYQVVDATNLGASNLDAAITSRNSTTPPTVTAIRTEMDTNSTKLANLDAAISTRTKPADTQAAVTLVTTTTNLTNAPGAGDFTAVMKTSLNAATPTVTAGTVSDKTGYSLSVTPPTAIQVRTEIDANSTKLDAAVSTRSTPSDVLTQVNSAIDAAGTELASIPTSTGSIRQKLNFIFQYLGFKRTTTSTTETLYKANNSTSLGTSAVSDDGSTATHGKVS